MSSAARMRRRRATLFKQQDGKCYWCECPMLFVAYIPKRQRMPKDLCTIDHLRDRFDPARRERCKPGEQRLVAACWECNNRRGRERQAQISKKTLNRRSRNHPRPRYEVPPAAPIATLADAWPT
jgi:hypothetical protein